MVASEARETAPAKSPQRLLRVACWPFSAGNPYQRLFYRALKAHGVNLVEGMRVDDRWLKTNAEEIDAVHFHWPETIWRSRGQGFMGSMRGVAGLWRFLRLAKRLGKRVCWTIHNTEHHEGSSWIDRRGYELLAQYADLAICHSELARQEIQQEWRLSELVVMPHGNYEGAYPVPQERHSVLRDLQMRADIPTFACLGLIRDYKNFELAAEAVTLIDQNVQLIIAGSITRQFDSDSLRRIVEKNPNIRLIDRGLSPQEFADIAGASDAVILPYRKITGSGALLAAWTFGTPVIASDLPYFREASDGEPLAVQFFESGNCRKLVKAIESFLTKERGQQRAAARRLSVRYRWDRCVEPVAEALRKFSG